MNMWVFATMDLTKITIDQTWLFDRITFLEWRNDEIREYSEAGREHTVSEIKENYDRLNAIAKF